MAKPADNLRINGDRLWETIHAIAEIGPQPVVAEPLADLYQSAGYVRELVELCRSTADAAALFAPDGTMPADGETLKNIALADAIEVIHPRSLKHWSGQLTALIHGRLWLQVLVAMVLGVGLGIALGLLTWLVVGAALAARAGFDVGRSQPG